MRYWWVNQNQTYKHETEGGFLWSPKRNRNGRSNRFYDNMTEVRAGDLVLSFCDTQIKAIGIAQGSAQSAVKPEFGNVGKQWDDDGWYVPVEFEEASNPMRPKDFIDELRPYLAAKYAPLQPNGNGNQGVYLAEVSEPFAKTILTRMDITLDPTLISDEAIVTDMAEEQAEAAIQGRTDIGATQKAQMILARRGQGIFRSNVRLNERACRITGVTDQRFLIASHIKPWRLCDDIEKLDGCNGLLLSPHIDRLFDKGYISFADDGTILKSSKMPDEVWDGWGLTDESNTSDFSDAQKSYLEFHRASIFQNTHRTVA
jgi:PAS domain-containing protein